MPTTKTTAGSRPARARVRGVHLAVATILLLAVGPGVLISAAHIHDRLALVAALWLGALLLVAVSETHVGGRGRVLLSERSLTATPGASEARSEFGAAAPPSH
jgi:UPF0716 family protein affecting phage T7 exclusion